MTRTNYEEILRGVEPTSMAFSDITALVDTNGDVWGWRGSGKSSAYAIFPAIANYSDPFAKVNVSSRFFPNGISFKPSKTNITNVSEVVSMSSNHIIYKDKQGEYKLIGQYGNFNTDEIYSLSDIIDAKDGVFLTSNNILQFGLNLGGNVPTQLDSNVTRIVGGARATQTCSKVMDQTISIVCSVIIT